MTKQDAQGPQEPAEGIVHAEAVVVVGPNRGQGTGYALCDTGDGAFDGGTLAHSSWQVNCEKCLAWPDEPQPETERRYVPTQKGLDYLAERRQQHPRMASQP